MTSEENIAIHFDLPFSAKVVFDFIIKPSNMPLYQGFLLIPGIKHVVSSDLIRKVGTIDKVHNTDSSSHESLTQILNPEAKYSLQLSNIQAVGFKKKLANPIVGFREDWIFKNHGEHTYIERTLVVIYKKSFFNLLFIKLFICPQLHLSLLKHHKNVHKALSSH